MKDKKKILILCGIILLLIIIGIIIFCLLNKSNNNSISNDKKIYEMTIEINPSVKLYYSFNNEVCTYGDSECIKNDTKVENYELLNEDADNIYKDIDFKDKDIFDALLMMCDEAKKSNIEFNSITIHSNYNISDEGIKNYIENNSEYDYVLTINYDYKDDASSTTSIINIVEKETIKFEIMLSKSLFTEKIGEKTLNYTKDTTTKIIDKLRTDFPDVNIEYEFKETGAEQFNLCIIIDKQDENGKEYKDFMIPEMCNKVLINGKNYSFKYSRINKTKIADTLHIPGNTYTQNQYGDSYIFQSDLDRKYGGSFENRYQACLSVCKSYHPENSEEKKEQENCIKECSSDYSKDDYSLYYDFYMIIKGIIEK